MSVASATVTLGNLTGSPLNWQDTGTYGTIVSRTLVITNSIGTVLENVSLGAMTNYSFAISTDNWYAFTATIVDNTGTYTSVVYYVSTGFYWAAYLPQFTSTNCGCQGNNSNLEISQLLLQAALRFNLAGASCAASAQSCIQGANYFVNLNVVSQYT